MDEKCVEVFGYIAGGLAVAGVLLNNHKLIWCFPVWIISNSICYCLHRSVGLNSLAWRDLMFTILAIHGWYKWARLNRAA